ncbi:fatty acid oxidation complex subunit alpha FadJ [Photobacterium carnosum]|uniref:fatty acid oxidation complex subunit alpha FadJ n=1 Tax=Photobacterium carnosum TaxID=2023717 RepID=UPI001E2AD144|nr:fatty acid oxidation complex subunit alpha FadJ [Photobacterium carnosum]MCD9528633.1 fatty acid oxidation complex subunit alpha FadJ [Photobacterium carnosum]MCF2152778.1 fatty acid oxidation complex subunit alpha FadJ [Photobacterium carnosum]MCF2214538.1 fatty acid oxidation complex subunit alpha FadJ [Photobacterium carnosum]
MTQSAFSLSYGDNGIGWLKIDVANDKMNTLQAAFADQVSAVFIELSTHTDLKGLVVYSGKSDNFIAGADIRMLAECKTAAEAEALAIKGQQLFTALEDLPVHVVAAIHGPCLGGGLELALACHSRICTDDDITRLGLPEVQLGLLPGSGGTQRLPRLIGVAHGLELMLTGKQVRAKQALQKGLVDQVVPQSILLQAAEQVALTAKPIRTHSFQDWAMTGNAFGRSVVFDQAAKKAQQKARGCYPAIDAILDTVKYGLEKGVEAGLEQEAKVFGDLVMTAESRALRSIFFATTAMKKELGVDAKPNPITRIAVLGGGLMGGGIAHVSAIKAGYAVRIKDITNDGIQHALAYNYAILNQQRQRHIIRKSQLQQQMLRITGSIDYRGMVHADVVIEAVFEDIALKQQMVQEVEANTSEHTIFATNTSSIPIHQIAVNAQRPQNIVGLHYFSPVEKMPLVEVIPHATTSATTIATVVALAKKQGKMPIVVADKAGFYVNRILAPYMNEAAQILLAGEPIEHIDTALLNFGFPVGPITLLDEVGVDIGAKISPILVTGLGERFAPPALFDVLQQDGRKGRKSGKGFYLYNTNNKEVDKSIYTVLGVEPQQQLTEVDIAIRCTLMMLNEAARCLHEGVIKSARDGDIGAIFGFGFPPFLGGPFRYMDHLGIGLVVDMMRQYSDSYGDRFAPCNYLVEMAQAEQRFY